MLCIAPPVFADCAGGFAAKKKGKPCKKCATEAVAPQALIGTVVSGVIIAGRRAGWLAGRQAGEAGRQHGSLAGWQAVGKQAGRRTGRQTGRLAGWQAVNKQAGEQQACMHACRQAVRLKIRRQAGNLDVLLAGMQADCTCCTAWEASGSCAG